MAGEVLANAVVKDAALAAKSFMPARKLASKWASGLPVRIAAAAVGGRPEDDDRARRCAACEGYDHENRQQHPHLSLWETDFFAAARLLTGLSAETPGV